MDTFTSVKRAKAFSLIEILVVLIILALLLGLTLRAIAYDTSKSSTLALALNRG